MHSLFWLVYKSGRDLTVVIQPGGSLGFARLKAAVAGIEGEFQEGHELDAKTAKKVPKGMIGRVLTRKEAAALLKRLA
jgi:hypothetical protein